MCKLPSKLPSVTLLHGGCCPKEPVQYITPKYERFNFLEIEEKIEQSKIG
jgi:hypothetical protein